MLHRQLTDEMNLELEQRRKDFEQRSRQLEEQSRCGLLANGNVCMLPAYTHLFSVLPQGNCRTQSPTRKPDRPECKLTERAARRTAKGCCNLEGKTETISTLQSPLLLLQPLLLQMYPASMDAVLFTHDQLVSCFCVVFSSVVIASHADLHDQQQQQPCVIACIGRAVITEAASG